MCNSTLASKEKPDETLRNLLASELDIYLDKTAIKLFIRAHWKELRTLAHAIHGSERPDEKPMAVATAPSDGGDWRPWHPADQTPYVQIPYKQSAVRTVHAIKFKDGSVWDTFNGWRT